MAIRSFRTFKNMQRAKIAWSSEDVADEYELQLQHELEMLQVSPGIFTSGLYMRLNYCIELYI